MVDDTDCIQCGKPVLGAGVQPRINALERHLFGKYRVELRFGVSPDGTRLAHMCDRCLAEGFAKHADLVAEAPEQPAQ